MNIQDELQKIHHQYGTSERANYEIEKLFDKEILPYKIKSAKWEQLGEKISKEDYEKALLIKDRFENSCSKCGNKIGTRWEYSANSFKLNLNIDCQSTDALFGERANEIGFNHPAIAKWSGYQGLTIESGIELPFKLCPSCNREFASLVGSFLIACL